MEIVFSPFQRPRFFTLTKPTPEEQTAFEENALKGLEHLIGDGKFAVGDKLTLADLSLISYLILVLEPPVTEVEKFPKLLSYYQRVKAELPYFDEINAPGIAAITKIWSILK